MFPVTECILPMFDPLDAGRLVWAVFRAKACGLAVRVSGIVVLANFFGYDCVKRVWPHSLKRLLLPLPCLTTET